MVNNKTALGKEEGDNEPRGEKKGGNRVITQRTLNFCLRGSERLEKWRANQGFAKIKETGRGAKSSPTKKSEGSPVKSLGLLGNKL